ncbi:hypothetical protein FG064_16405 [Vibrio cholerae]|uniref:hypothetical protein n=1 Tax=Vibrio cholerae TaxID=666 RepID=UPI0011DA151E|nr:hypothetical protein [Vibrio cholerae]EGR0468579.1 hypothetical protein [Vibrio cholerae]TXY52039.1 hypothetical protein FXE74_18800 [Vibrio cholerae]GIB31934.1 hypothetical protein VCSRO91_2869 [Vibrio cholerae]
MNVKIFLLTFFVSFFSIASSGEGNYQFNIYDFKVALEQAKSNAINNPTTENLSWYQKLSTLSVDYSVAIATNDDVEPIIKKMSEAISKGKAE